MTVCLHLRALDAVVEVVLPDEVEQRVRQQWSHCVQPPPSQAVPEELRLNLTGPNWALREDDDEQHGLEYSLATQVTALGIGHLAGQRLMFHAAGVVDPVSGRMALLVAESGTGKTTAAQRLCQNGMLYVSDETVALDEQFVSLRYPKPLSVVLPEDAAYLKSQHGPDELDMAVAQSDPRLHLTVLLERDRRSEGPSQVRLEPIDPLSAILDLIPQTSALPAMARPLSRLVAVLRHTGGAYRLHYREIVEAIPLLRQALEQAEPVALEHLVLHQPDPDSEPDLTASRDEDVDLEPVQAQTRVQRGPFTEAVQDGSELVLLVGSSTLHLSGLGATTWLSSAQPVSVGDLTQLCVQEHGEHPDAASLVSAAVEQLIGHHVLVQV